jgi:hypothetical protein
MAGFLYKTYVLGQEPPSLDALEEDTDDSPPAPTPVLQPA